jgi:hypothetical protein
VKGVDGAKSLGTVVNGVRDGSCNSGLCQISGGTGAGRNLFHRFGAFDTRGGISGVRIQSDGYRNVMVGVINPLGSFIDKSVALSSKGNLFWLSPGGIRFGVGGGFVNVQHLQLSTATGLRIGAGLFDALGTTADQASLLLDEPLRGRAGLLTDPTSLSEIGLQANGDLSLDGGTLTVEESLLLDGQGGNVVLQAAQVLLPGGAVEISGRDVRASGSTVDVSNTSGTGGSVAVSGETVSLSSSRIDASGSGGGGVIELEASQSLALSGSTVAANGGNATAAPSEPVAPAPTESATSPIAEASPSEPAGSAETPPEPTAPAPSESTDSTITAETTGGTSEIATAAADPPASTSEPPSSLPMTEPGGDSLTSSVDIEQPAADGLSTGAADGGLILLQAPRVQLDATELQAIGQGSPGTIQQRPGSTGSWSFNAIPTGSTEEMIPTPEALDVSPEIAPSLTFATENPSGKGGSIRIDAGSILQSGSLNVDGVSGGSVRLDTTDWLESSANISARGGVGTGGLIQISSTNRAYFSPDSLLDVRGSSSGGSIVIATGGELELSGSVAALGTAGSSDGGTVQITADSLRLIGVRIEADGGQAGGEILIGSDLFGSALPSGARSAKNVVVDAASRLNADARWAGDGGRIIVYATDAMQMSGYLSARAGQQSGDGGLIEVSSAGLLRVDGSVSTQAPQGRTGNLFIDPQNLWIGSEMLRNYSYDGYFSPESVQALLQGSNVALFAVQDIQFNDGQIMASSSLHDLVFAAGRNITLGPGVNLQLGGDLTFVNNLDLNPELSYPIPRLAAGPGLIHFTTNQIEADALRIHSDGGVWLEQPFIRLHGVLNNVSGLSPESPGLGLDIHSVNTGSGPGVALQGVIDAAVGDIRIVGQGGSGSLRDPRSQGDWYGGGLPPVSEGGCLTPGVCRNSSDGIALVQSSIRAETGGIELVGTGGSNDYEYRVPGVQLKEANIATSKDINIYGVAGPAYDSDGVSIIGSELTTQNGNFQIRGQAWSFSTNERYLVEGCDPSGCGPIGWDYQPVRLETPGIWGHNYGINLLASQLISGGLQSRDVLAGDVGLFRYPPPNFSGITEQPGQEWSGGNLDLDQQFSPNQRVAVPYAYRSAGVISSFSSITSQSGLDLYGATLPGVIASGVELSGSFINIGSTNPQPADFQMVGIVDELPWSSGPQFSSIVSAHESHYLSGVWIGSSSVVADGSMYMDGFIANAGVPVFSGQFPSAPPFPSNGDLKQLFVAPATFNNSYVLAGQKVASGFEMSFDSGLIANGRMVVNGGVSANILLSDSGNNPAAYERVYGVALHDFDLFSQSSPALNSVVQAAELEVRGYVRSGYTSATTYYSPNNRAGCASTIACANSIGVSLLKVRLQSGLGQSLIEGYGGFTVASPFSGEYDPYVFRGNNGIRIMGSLFEAEGSLDVLGVAGGDVPWQAYNPFDGGVNGYNGYASGDGNDGIWMNNSGLRAGGLLNIEGRSSAFANGAFNSGLFIDTGLFDDNRSAYNSELGLTSQIYSGFEAHVTGVVEGPGVFNVGIQSNGLADSEISAVSSYFARSDDVSEADLTLLNRQIQESISQLQLPGADTSLVTEAILRSLRSSLLSEADIARILASQTVESRVVFQADGLLDVQGISLTTDNNGNPVSGFNSDGVNLSSTLLIGDPLKVQGVALGSGRSRDGISLIGSVVFASDVELTGVSSPGSNSLAVTISGTSILGDNSGDLTITGISTGDPNPLPGRGDRVDVRIADSRVDGFGLVEVLGNAYFESTVINGASINGFYLGGFSSADLGVGSLGLFAAESISAASSLAPTVNPQVEQARLVASPEVAWNSMPILANSSEFGWVGAEAVDLDPSLVLGGFGEVSILSPVETRAVFQAGEEKSRDEVGAALGLPATSSRSGWFSDSMAAMIQSVNAYFKGMKVVAPRQ